MSCRCYTGCYCSCLHLEVDLESLTTFPYSSRKTLCPKGYTKGLLMTMELQIFFQILELALVMDRTMVCRKNPFPSRIFLQRYTATLFF